MKPLYLIAHNLYSYENLNLDFKPYYNGTTMILGKNLDMNSANGAGKSAILRLIYLALFGKDLKGVAYEKIVREGSEGGSLVAYAFEDAGSVFKIVRWKNYKKTTCPIVLGNGKIPSGSGIEFSVDNVPFNIDKDNDSVEEMIASKLGMSGKVFLNSILTQQKKDNNFLEQSDGEKKELLSNIFDLDFYEKALKLVKNDITRTEEQIAVAKNKKEIFEKQLESETQNILQLESKIVDENLSKKNRIESLNNDILKLNKEVVLLEKELNNLKELDQSELEKKLKEALDKKNILEKELQIETELIKNKSEKEQTIKSLSEYRVKFSKDKEDLIKRQTELKNQIESLPQPQAILELQAELTNEQKIFQEQNKQIAQLKLKLANENSLIKEKTTLENKEKQLTQELSQLNTEITNLELELKCTECLRAFKPGESELFDNLVLAKSNKKTQLEIQIKECINELHSAALKLSNLTNLKQQLEQEEKTLNNLQNKINQIKVTYEKQVSLNKQHELLNSQMQEINIRLEKITIDLDKIDKKYSQSALYLENLNPLLKELDQLKIQYQTQSNLTTQLTLDLKSLELTNLNIQNQKKSFKDKQEQIENIKIEIARVSNEENSLSSILVMSKKKQSDLVVDLKEINEQLDIYYAQMKYLNFWEIGFSKTGIRSFILDDIINLLNFKTKENLDILSDRTLSLMFQPEQKSQKGITSNKISTLMYVNGVERVFELNSGGEAQRLTLAVDLALSDIAEARAGSNFNMKFLDEPFDGIDTNGQIKALALFNKLAQTRNGFFLISHDKEMQAFCDNTIYIIKENGISRLVDKETFMSLETKN